MKGFILGTIFGIVIATVGFGGVAQWLDHGVEKTKSFAAESIR